VALEIGRGKVGRAMCELIHGVLERDQGRRNRLCKPGTAYEIFCGGAMFVLKGAEQEILKPGIDEFRESRVETWRPPQR